MLIIREYTNSDKNTWDEYVLQHPDSTVFHTTVWKQVIEEAFGHKSIYLLAFYPEPCAVSPVPFIQPNMPRSEADHHD